MNALHPLIQHRSDATPHLVEHVKTVVTLDDDDRDYLSPGTQLPISLDVRFEEMKAVQKQADRERQVTRAIELVKGTAHNRYYHSDSDDESIDAIRAPSAKESKMDSSDGKKEWFDNVPAPNLPPLKTGQAWIFELTCREASSTLFNLASAIDTNLQFFAKVKQVSSIRLRSLRSPCVLVGISGPSHRRKDKW
jgi:hypothetical protein